MSENAGIRAGSVKAGHFKAAHAALDAGGGWATAAKACCDALGELPPGANLGFLYVTDLLADDLGSVLTFLREKTRIETWVGSVGIGVVSGGAEFYGCPAISLLVGALPDEAFRLFAPVVHDLEDFNAEHGDWIAQRHPILGVVHGDPRNRDVAEIIADVAERTSAYLVGGLTSSRGPSPQIAGEVTEGGLSGVLLASDQLVVAGLTQGCTPIGPPRCITDGEDMTVKTLDDRPALEVLKEDVGELLARDLSRIGGYIYVSFPIPGSDTGDYLVRNLMGVDQQRGWIEVGERVTRGSHMNFCRRDHAAAQEDLNRMLRDVDARAGSVPRAALYYSCIARGQHLFGPNSEEMLQIRANLGDIPLTGFFANGEICNNRLYGYTGVLALLL